MQLSSPVASLPNFSSRILVTLLDEAGCETEPILRAAELSRSALADPGLLLCSAQECAVLRGFARATARRQDLWVAAALHYRMFAYDPLGFAQATAPTLADALTLAARFAQLHYMVSNFEPITTEDGLYGISVYYDDAPDDIADFLRCRDTIAITNWLHDLWGGRFPFARIETATELPALEGFDYRAPTVRSADRSRWFWHEAVLQAAPAHADPLLHEVYLARCEALLANASQPTRPPGNVSDALLEKLMQYIEEKEHFDWNLDRMAKALHMSRRSLQRKLAERNVSFRSVIDASRARIAQRLLADNEHSIAEIAWRLGYADSSSFHQAFKRWTSMSPGLFQRTRRAGQSPARPTPADSPPPFTQQRPSERP